MYVCGFDGEVVVCCKMWEFGLVFVIIGVFWLIVVIIYEVSGLNCDF